jgi:hypothetical protein
MAIGLAQSLGWHRETSLVGLDEEQQNRQKMIFWFLYVIDKGLSLRLGRASNLQDYDIDLPLPGPQYVPVSDKFAGMFQRWVNEARVQGLIYEKLYSPHGLKQSAASRAQIVNELVTEAHRIRDHYLEVCNPHFQCALSFLHTDLRQLKRPVDHNFAGTFKGVTPQRILHLIDKADDVQFYALLATLYRVMPSAESHGGSTLNQECIAAARTAITQHLLCTHEFREIDDEVWSFYLHWTVLQAPFAPFLILFCNVLTTHDMEDLARIEAFANSIAGNHFSDAAQKLHRMCSVFSQVAKLYVEARTPEVHTYVQQTPQIAIGVAQNTMPTTQPWGPLAPYVDAMNFAGDPMMNWGDMTSMNWTDWLQGNQSVMNILENNSPP